MALATSGRQVILKNDCAAPVQIIIILNFVYYNYNNTDIDKLNLSFSMLLLQKQLLRSEIHKIDTEAILVI